MFDLLNLLAFLWFLGCWFGYMAYARHQAKQRASLSSVLYRLRLQWAERMLLRAQPRVMDMNLLGHLNRTVTFFASTTLFLIAGVITLLANTKQIHALLSSYHFIAASSEPEVKIKLMILGVMFIYTFFTFTWAMRQYSFAGVLFGAAPDGITHRDLNDQERMYARKLAKLTDLAGHQFNYGLRAYYFALAFLAWFVHPALFMVCCVLVVAILYRREFNSRTLDLLLRSLEASGEEVATLKAGDPAASLVRAR